MDVHGKRVSVEWCGMPLVIQWLCPERQNSGCTTYGWQTYTIIYLYPVALGRKGSRDGALWTNEHSDFLLQRFGSRPRLTFLTEVAHLGRSVFGLWRQQCNIQLHKLFLQDMFKRDGHPLEGWFQSVWEQVLHYRITIVKTYRKGLPELVAILVIWVANVSPGWFCVLAFLTSPEGPSRWTVG